MVSKKVTVKNPTGLHLRPAGILCNEAMKYQSQVTFDYDGGTANAKSVLSVLGACVKCGDEIEIICEGKDEQTALLTSVDLMGIHHNSALRRLPENLRQLYYREASRCG